MHANIRYVGSLLKQLTRHLNGLRNQGLYSPVNVKELNKQQDKDSRGLLK